MKTAGAANGSLRKSIAAKDAADIAATTDKLVAAFKTTQGHFEEHPMQDGIQAATNLAAAAKAGDWDKAADELKTIGAQCQGCHAAHREKLPDGSYKMK